MYLDRVRENIRRMISIASSVHWLRPHIKTHKLAEVLNMQMEQGIAKFKCATFAEAEMAAGCGAADVLLAYPTAGPNAQRVVGLVRSFARTRISGTAADPEASRGLSGAFTREGWVLAACVGPDFG